LIRPPTIFTMPAGVTVDVDAVTDNVCFSNDTIGHLTASDVWTSSPTVEYSLDGLIYFPSNNGAGQMDCSNDFPSGTSFGPNANTVFWRAVDDAGNTSTYQQTVTLNLPAGIVGKPCTVDLTTPGFRVMEGNFIMRQPDGGQTGTTDNGVTGIIDPTKLCLNEACSNLGTGDDIVGATMEAGQLFFGIPWTARPITLFGPGTWTFDACPGNDRSSKFSGYTPLSMTVKDTASNNGIPQLGAHMLFEWGDSKDIDVVVVWDVDCGV